MRDDLDYEMVYEVIQTRGTEQQKKDLNTAIRSAFKEMDNNIRTCKPPLPRGHSCCQFISRIVQDQTPSFIFTLNQDMFFERYHSREKLTVVPGLPDHLNRFRDADQNSTDFGLRLPAEDELEPKKAELFRKRFAQIAYVKLHGSQGWLSHGGSDAMVIGAQKESRIESEPLLKWYFSLFEQVLNQPDTRLLIVGYSFRDEHINQCIVKAIDNGLKLYVISPESPQDFKNHFKPPLHGKFEQRPCGEKLWDVLVQYWPTKLTDFYYENVSPPGDLNPRGRALFRSLGLT